MVIVVHLCAVLIQCVWILSSCLLLTKCDYFMYFYINAIILFALLKPSDSAQILT